ncbi:MAG TPA: hypothetical protein DCY56_04680 [Candidatus Omnitrophica bacterium]|nr:hypothetical protein [Candidatus Omnitrophota bacterium]
MLEEFDSFININKDFWSKFNEIDTNKLILVETAGHPTINHANAVTAKMIARAKGFRIAWIKYNATDEKLMQSYSENSIFLSFKKHTLFFKIRLKLIAIHYYLMHVLVRNRLLSFEYKGIRYGDFIYDGYLAQYSMATLHRFDARIAKIFYSAMLYDEEAREILKRNSAIKAVLVTHYMGIGTGCLSRVCLQQNIPVYLKVGGCDIFGFSVFNRLSEVYNYPLKPTKDEIDFAVSNYKNEIEKDFKNFIEEVSNKSKGGFNIAYDNNIHSDVTREQFLKHMALEDKPIIFIMLHAFNDFPRSHFESMLFNDFYDWFIQTLKFVSKVKSRNWIFKEHPTNRFYPTKDLDLNKIMRHLPEHVRFVSQDHVIKSSVVLNVADAIVTCLGTAGVEMPALQGIPSIIASDTFYDGLGFTIKPSTKKEYFEILANMDLKPLSAEQQLRAKCCYLYLYKYCMMPFAAGPPITVEEISIISKQLMDSYNGRVSKAYKEKSDLIYSQFYEYAGEIKKEGFKRLVRLPFDLMEMSDYYMKLFVELKD